MNTLNKLNEFLIIDKIIETRKEKKISQKQVGEHLGLSTATYQGMENRHSMKIDTMIKVCEFLEIDFVNLLNSILKKDAQEGETSYLAYTPKDIEEYYNDSQSKYKRLEDELKEIKELIKNLSKNIE